MLTTCIPSELVELVDTAEKLGGAIFIYQDDAVVFANQAARNIHPQQNWAASVTFDSIFRTSVELGRFDDRTILDDPEGHLAYAKMVRARERRHSFQRSCDGILYDRHHIGLNREWNAQIWVEARHRDGVDGLSLAPDLRDRVEDGRALRRMTALMDRMGIAIAVVTADSRIVDVSPLMASQLCAGKLLRPDAGNILACQDKAHTDQLRHAIGAVARGREQAVLFPLPIGGAVQPVAVMASPAPEGTAIVVVHDIAQADVLEDILISTYGLTRSQAEVAVRVAGGDTADDIAMALDRPYDTVRRQIATSKAKIAAGRHQHGLAHIVTRVAGLFGGIPPATTSRGKQ